MSFYNRCATRVEWKNGGASVYYGHRKMRECRRGSRFVKNGTETIVPGAEVEVEEPVVEPVVVKGEQGPAGNDGIQGPPGPAGKDGAQGPPGPTGKDGAQGPAGPAGKDGAQGPAGPAGRDGKDGAQGPAGKDGAQGPAGPAGRDGKDGAQGPAGRDGKDGAKGEKGDKGDQGPPGPPGPVVTVNSSSAVVQGPPGPAGKDGAKGEKGDKGDKGDQGPAGKDGAQGPAGPAGKDGKDGSGLSVRHHRKIYVEKIVTDHPELESISKPFASLKDAIQAAASLKPTDEAPVLIIVGVGNFDEGDVIVAPYVNIEGSGISTVIRGRFIGAGSTQGAVQVSKLSIKSEVAVIANVNPNLLMVFDNVSFDVRLKSGNQFQSAFYTLGGPVDIRNCRSYILFFSTIRPLVSIFEFPSDNATVGMLHSINSKYTVELLADHVFSIVHMTSGAEHSGETSLFESNNNRYIIRKKVSGNVNNNFYLFKNDSPNGSIVKSDHDHVQCQIIGATESSCELVAAHATPNAKGKVIITDLNIESRKSSTEFYRCSINQSPNGNEKYHFIQGIRWNTLENPEPENTATTQVQSISTLAGFFSGSSGSRLLSKELQTNVPFVIPDDVGSVEAIPRDKNCTLILPDAEKFKDREIKIKNSGKFELEVKVMPGSPQRIDMEESITVGKNNKGVGKDDVLIVHSNGVNWVRF